MFIKVKVSAGSKRESFKKVSGDTCAISVREPAERGLANTRVLELVRKHFNVYNKSVRIVSGHQSPSKIISIS